MQGQHIFININGMNVFSEVLHRVHHIRGQLSKMLSGSAPFFGVSDQAGNSKLGSCKDHSHDTLLYVRSLNIQYLYVKTYSLIRPEFSGLRREKRCRGRVYLWYHTVA